MKKNKYKLIYVLAVILVIFYLSGCKNSKEDDSVGYESFNYSDGIDDAGFWKGLRALDHVDLCDYSGILIPSEIYTISESTIKENIDYVLSGYAESMQVTDRAVKDGDTVNIDYVGAVDGSEFEGGSTEGAGRLVTIGVTNYIDGFLDQLIGHSPGEAFDINVTFPADYGNETLNGRNAVFSITINHIVETVLPDLTDEFVSVNLSSEYGWATASEMNTAIEENLQSSAVKTYIQEYVLKNSVVGSLPEKLTKYQENAMLSFYQEYADYYDMDIDAFLNEYVGFSGVEELLEEYSGDIAETARSYLVFQAIAEDSGITVNEDDMALYFLEYFGSEDYSEHEEYFGTGYLKMVVLNWKVMIFLETSAIWE